MRHIAIYARVSSKRQELKSQRPDLEQWAKGQESPVIWYEDKASGKTMQRPAWEKLIAAIRRNEIITVAVWRIDRLGRTAKGLTSLFEELTDRKVNLVSLKDGIDLATPAGRMVANVLASIAQFETELRGERVLAGQAVARAAGKRWGGSKPGVPRKVTPTVARIVRQLFIEGAAITDIARTVKLSRPTIYGIIKSNAPEAAK
jgi:DNA invertase Pin-like site-specific DNA recombinase